MECAGGGIGDFVRFPIMTFYSGCSFELENYEWANLPGGLMSLLCVPSFCKSDFAS
jgi:hypothetical protein